MAADCTELDATIAEIAFYYLDQQLLPKGTSLVDFAVGKVREHFPKLTHEEITNSVRNFQESQRADQDPIAKQLAAFKVQAQSEPKLKERFPRLERIAKNLPVAPVTPKERRAVSKVMKELRAMQKTLDVDAKSATRIKEVERKIESVDLSLANARKAGPKTQLQSRRDELNSQLGEMRSDDRRRVALEAQIESINKQIETGDFQPEPAKLKRDTPENLRNLQTKRDALVKQRDQLSGADQVQRNEQLTKSIEILEKRIAEGVTVAPSKATKVMTELEARKQKLQNQLQGMKNDVDRRERLREQIRSLQNALKTNNLTVPEAKAKQKIDREMADLIYQRDRLRTQIRQRIDDLRPLTFADILSTPGHFSKMMMASMDLSFGGRQGILSLLTGRFRIAARSFMAQLRSIKSEAGFGRIMDEINNRTNAPLYRKFKLELSEHIEALEGRGIATLVAHTPIRLSDRAFAAGGNIMRADLFDLFYESFGGNITQAEGVHLAALVNNMTLRASMNPGTAKFLNGLFFSARAWKARMSFVTGGPLWSAALKARSWRSFKLATKQYARALAGVSLIWGLAHLLGLLASDDPRSSDFLKIKLGDTRIDLFGGMSQYVTFLARAATQKTVVDGEERPLTGPDVGFGKRDMNDVIWDFIKSKASPQAGLVIEAVSDEEFGATPFDTRRALIKRVTPLVLNDMYESMQHEGMGKGAILSAFALLGIGVNTYGNDMGQGDPLPNSIIRMFGGTPNQLERDQGGRKRERERGRGR